MNSRDHIIYLMSKNVYDYKNNIISFRINGVLKPYFYLTDCLEFEKLKMESNQLRVKKENPIESFAKLLKPFL